MNCRIEELEEVKGPMAPHRIGNALFVLFCVNYDDKDLKNYYADAMDFLYETWSQMPRVGQSESQAQEVFF